MNAYELWRDEFVVFIRKDMGLVEEHEIDRIYSSLLGSVFIFSS
jgi:hypothetical protein